MQPYSNPPNILLQIPSLFLSFSHSLTLLFAVWRYCLFPSKRVSSLFSVSCFFPIQCSHFCHTAAWFWISFLGFFSDWLIFHGFLLLLWLILQIFGFRVFQFGSVFVPCCFFFHFSKILLGLILFVLSLCFWRWILIWISSMLESLICSLSLRSVLFFFFFFTSLSFLFSLFFHRTAAEMWIFYWVILWWVLIFGNCKPFWFVWFWVNFNFLIHSPFAASHLFPLFFLSLSIKRNFAFCCLLLKIAFLFCFCVWVGWSRRLRFFIIRISLFLRLLALFWFPFSFSKFSRNYIF